MARVVGVGMVVACAVACGGPDVAFSQSDTVAVAGSDSAVTAAAAALNAGRPWRATRLVAPALADSTRRTPEALFVAARAAAGWGGWARVDSLLAGASWVDSLFGGRARVLLAEAALARRADTAALAHARAAAAEATTDAERGVGLVLLARALDRLDQRDSARAAYVAASELLPPASDWLRLRAAGVTADPGVRRADYGRVADTAARARIAWTEAYARERTGDIAGAATVFDSLGARAAGFRLRIAASRDSAPRQALRDELVRYVEAQAGSPEGRTAVEVLDAAFDTLTASEQLAVGRALARGGPAARSATGFAAALRGGASLAPGDRFAYGQLLIRLDRDREAAAQLALVPASSPQAADAAYQRARALVGAGRAGEARTVLRRILSRWPRDTSAAAAALHLLGDLATDDGRDGAAREAFLDLARRYPTSPRAPVARFRAAIIAVAAGDARRAARELDSLVARYPRSDDALAATYWSGRAWARAGDDARARDRWRAAATRQPLSYYASAAARRLGEKPWAPPAAVDTFPVVAAVDSAMRRARLLERLGMDVEARLEHDQLAATAITSAERMLATGRAFADQGLTSRAIALGWRLIDRGVGDARAYRLAYPVAMADVLESVARERGLDPALVAGLIRQESSFNPRATSAVGARGLMQVMPDVGRELARRLRYPVWDPVLLWQPDVNLELGMAHLAGILRGGEPLPRALAGYNAGPSRARRWAAKAGADDPELFTERIPFDETRGYVRIVQRNRELYDALYDWR